MSRPKVYPHSYPDYDWKKDDESEDTSNLEAIQSDTILQILTYLRLGDLFSLMLTNRRFEMMINSTSSIWKMNFERYFGRYMHKSKLLIRWKDMPYIDWNKVVSEFCQNGVYDMMLSLPYLRFKPRLISNQRFDGISGYYSRDMQVYTVGIQMGERYNTKQANGISIYFELGKTYVSDSDFEISKPSFSISYTEGYLVVSMPNEYFELIDIDKIPSDISKRSNIKHLYSSLDKLISKYGIFDELLHKPDEPVYILLDMIHSFDILPKNEVLALHVLSEYLSTKEISELIAINREVYRRAMTYHSISPSDKFVKLHKSRDIQTQIDEFKRCNGRALILGIRKAKHICNDYDIEDIGEECIQLDSISSEGIYDDYSKYKFFLSKRVVFESKYKRYLLDEYLPTL